MKHNFVIKAVFVVLITLCFPLVASAGVNQSNGDFFITFRDIQQPSGGHELNLERTYNSLATGIGWFGYGWGTLYETRLVVLPDNSVAVKERGNGRTTFYHDKRNNGVNLGVERIIEAAIERDRLTPAAADALATKLRSSEDLRLEKVLQYGITTPLPKDAVLGDRCGEASLTTLGDGYRRIDCNIFGDSERATDTFDMQGRLVRHELADGYAITIRYSDSKNAVIRDSRGRSIELTWTPEGRVSTAKANNTELTYTYDPAQDLRKADIKDGLNYRYSYDDKHNLTQITYADDTKMTIDYFRKSGRVTSVTERNQKPVFYGSNIELGDPEPVQPEAVIPSDAGDLAYAAKDFQAASREWKSMADKNPAAQFKLAMMYYNGEGVTKDPIEGLSRLRKSASAGYAKAQWMLGLVYADGQGVTKDEKEAVRWYRMAADQHNAFAQLLLGLAYFRGEGVTTNRYEGVELIGKAANGGDVDAQFELGGMYARGIGVGHNTDKAKFWLLKAAEKGNVRAQNALIALKLKKELDNMDWSDF